MNSIITETKIAKNRKKSIVMKIILLVIGILLICNALLMLREISVNIGHVATFIFGCVYLIYGLYFEKIHMLSHKSLFKMIKNLFIIGNTIIIVVTLFIFVFGKIDTVTYREDAVIVLGYGLDGETITLPLYYRLEKTLEYYNKNPNAIIVLSGGQGPDEAITEALAMERFLLSKGVPENKIIKEERATSTYENFLFSKNLLDDYFNKEYKTAFITNDFHIFRSKEISKVVGIDSNYYVCQNAMVFNSYKLCKGVLSDYKVFYTKTVNVNTYDGNIQTYIKGEIQ